MKCKKCKENAVLADPALCKKHFLSYYEKKVSDTIKKYKLISKSDKVCVATSGGKDSTAVLYLVQKFLKPKKGQLQALLIDEGIAGYRDHTAKDLKKFCSENDIELKIASFKGSFGKTLDKILKSGRIRLKPCTICGTLRRYLLNKHAKGFDIIVTGHNRDDECQAVMMNLLRQQTEILARLGPMTGMAKRKGFVQRVKPLYFCSEKETALYALLMGFDVSFNECPNIIDSYRADVREMLNNHESRHSGAKQGIIESFIRELPKLKKQYSGSGPAICVKCGEPSSDKVCGACSLAAQIRTCSNTVRI